MNFLREMARVKFPQRIRQTPEKHKERINRMALYREIASRHTFHEGRGEDVFSYSETCLFLLSTNPPEFYYRAPFIVNITMNAAPEEKPIFFISCSVKIYFWPVAKDMLVIRTGLHSLAFALPDISFGIQFHPSCDQDTMSNAQRLFQLNCQFIDLAHENIYRFHESDPYFWSKITPFVHALAAIKLEELGHRYTRNPSGFCNRNTFFYISVVTTMVRSAVLSGRLMKKGIEYLDGRPSSEEDEEATYPSVTAVTRIVEAMDSNDPLRMLRMGTTSSSYSALWNSWKQEKLRRINFEKLGVRLWRTNQWSMGESLHFLIKQRNMRREFLESQVKMMMS